MQSPIVAPDELASWIRDARPDLRIVDVRWYLGQPAGAGRAAYDAGHLPGAIHLDVDGDLTARKARAGTPSPILGAFASNLAAAGIGDDDVVVAYDDVGGWVAARLWWMLEDLEFGTNGRGRVLVLDGGIPAWVAAGLPTSTEVADARGGIAPPRTCSGGGSSIDPASGIGSARSCSSTPGAARDTAAKSSRSTPCPAISPPR